MQCPVCGVQLLVTLKESIEVDYCPNGHGVWLDAGELERIVARAAELDTGPVHSARSTSPAKRKMGKRYPDSEPYYDRRPSAYGKKHRERDDYHDDRRDKRRRFGKRGKDFLEELFDIFD